MDDMEVFVDVLDDTRIHPESYNLAYKIASDAREVVPEGGDMGLANERQDCVQAVVEVMEDTQALNDLNLEDFAQQLLDTGFGMKKATLDDICSELKVVFGSDM